MVTCVISSALCEEPRPEESNAALTTAVRIVLCGIIININFICTSDFPFICQTACLPRHMSSCKILSHSKLSSS
ncbi:hypothetical protein CapIbe_021601 [Capra ibex]